MSGLLLKLAAGERVMVNGAVIENGHRPARLRIGDGDARILRCSDALLPEDVDTPAKRIYYAVQLIITGDLEPADALDAIFQACDELDTALSFIDPELIPTAKSLMSRGSYYSALCSLKTALSIEEGLLSRAVDGSSGSKVA